ncbi:coniferyl aldehyde dehydrogenase [uncultured Legionella sp.]|uniref:coniferyl aldehyde dehydrogenase n=1 Tax=uncultured Legionella sp. TaxID=210934 RepID=UPI00261D8A91|nr:coniferyl aldehyde dehydrogenase [uncultured Legionella sp.]
MDLKSQFEALERQYKLNPFPALKERKNILLAIKKIVQQEAYTIAEAVNKDFTHRSTDETLFLEIFPTIRAIDYCLKKMKHWMKKRRRNVSWLFLPASAYVIPQPLGVIGNLVPWNYPVYLSIVPALYALAAGNRVMIKMSELSTHTGLVLHSLFHTMGLDNFIQVVNGGIDVSEQFSELPFGHLMFTGSTRVGKLVMKAASENLTPVTLELGGKSPAILSSTMNINYFKRLFMGKLFNAAQTCIAPDYLLVPEGWDRVVEAEFKKFIHVHYPELMSNDNYSSIITSDHKARLLDILDDARLKGARIVEFGTEKSRSNKMPMYLLFNATNDMKVMKEELFGPVLPVLNYKKFDDAIAYVNASPNPLVLYYFGESKQEKEDIQIRTLSGALTINDTIMHVAIDDLPFGGVGHSGMGQYHGPEGFNTFSKLKPVLVQKRFSPCVLLYPPYGRLMKLFLTCIAGIKTKKNNDEVS